MKIYNPYKEKPAQEPASATAGFLQIADEDEMATASAMTNTREDICPKCGGKMGAAFLFNSEQVHYCGQCRVSHPRTKL